MWTTDEPGLATYTLSEDGNVRLDVLRDDGRTEQHVGPPLQPLPRAHRAAIRVPAYLYLGATALGAVAGGLLSSGTERWTSVGVGALFGILGAYLVLRFVILVARHRHARAKASFTR